MSSEFKNGVINSIVVDGHTYQNIVPSDPTLRNSVYHKYMQRFNYGYEDVIVKGDNPYDVDSPSITLPKYAFMYGDTLLNIATERENLFIGSSVKGLQTQKLGQQFGVVYVLDGVSSKAIIKGETLKYVLPKARCFNVENVAQDGVIYSTVKVIATEENQSVEYKSSIEGRFFKDVIYTLYTPQIGKTEREIFLEVENAEYELIDFNNEYIVFKFNKISNEESIVRLVQKFNFINKINDTLMPYVSKDVIVVEGNYFNIPLQILDGGLHGIELEELSFKTVGKNLFNNKAAVLGRVTEDGRVDDEGLYFEDETDIAIDHMRSEYIQIIPSKTYTISLTGEILGEVYRPVWSWFDKQRNFIKQDKTIDVDPVLTAVAPDNAEFLIIHVGIENEDPNLIISDHINGQLEEGETATDFVSYKENTISFDQPGRLHRIGDVYDELDVNKLVITRRIEEEIDENGNVVLTKLLEPYEEPVKGLSVGNIVKIDFNQIKKDRWIIEPTEDSLFIKLASLKGSILEDLSVGYFEIVTNLPEIFNRDNIIIDKDGYALSVEIKNDTELYEILTNFSDIIVPYSDEPDMTLCVNNWVDWLSQNPIIIWCESDVRQVSNVNELLSFENGYLIFNPIRRVAEYNTQIVDGVEIINELRDYVNVGCSPTIPSMDFIIPASNSFVLNMLKPNTYYTLSNYGESVYVIIDNRMIFIENNIFKTPEVIETKMVIYEKVPVNPDQIMIIEGDHRGKDIPFFEGTMDVKSPEVRILGKNLFDKSKLDPSSAPILDAEPTQYYSTHYIEVQPNESYIKLHIENDKYIANSASVEFYTEDKTAISNAATAYIFTTPKDARYIRFNIDITSQTATNIDTLQIEQRHIPDFDLYVNRDTGEITGLEFSYSNYFETHNIVSDENLVMRSVEDVKDIYDLKTRRFTKNVEEITFTGEDSEWEKISEGDTALFRFTIKEDSPMDERMIIASNKYSHMKSEMEPCVYAEDKYIFLRIPSNKILSFVDSPIYIRYALGKVDSVVPVQDMTSFRSIKDGTISVSSKGILPTIEYEVETKNSFHIDALQCNRDIENNSTIYTIKWNGTAVKTMTFSIDGLEYKDIANNTTIEIPNTVRKVLVIDNIKLIPMLILGDVTQLDVPYFTGIRTIADTIKSIPVSYSELRNNNNSGEFSIDYKNNIILSSLPDGKKERIIIDMLHNFATFKRRTKRVIIDKNSKILEIKKSDYAGYTQVTISLSEEGVNNLFCDKFDTRYFFNNFVFIDEKGLNFVISDTLVWDEESFKDYLATKSQSKVTVIYELKKYRREELITNINDILVASEYTSVVFGRGPKEMPYYNIEFNQSTVSHISSSNELTSNKLISVEDVNMTNKEDDKEDDFVFISSNANIWNKDIIHHILDVDTENIKFYEDKIVITGSAKVSGRFINLGADEYILSFTPIIDMTGHFYNEENSSIVIFGSKVNRELLGKRVIRTIRANEDIDIVSVINSDFNRIELVDIQLIKANDSKDNIEHASVYTNYKIGTPMFTQGESKYNNYNGTPVITVLKDGDVLRTNAVVKPMLSLRGKKYRVNVKPETTYTISFDLEGEVTKLEFDLAGSKFEYDGSKPVIITTPEVLKHGYLFIKGSKCKISKVVVVEGTENVEYFKYANSVGKYEENTIKLDLGESTREVELLTDLRSLGNTRDVYNPDLGLIEQHIAKKILDGNETWVFRGMENEYQIFYIEDIVVKTSDIKFYSSLFTDLGETCFIDENGHPSLKLNKYLIDLEENVELLKDILEHSPITIYYVASEPEKLYDRSMTQDLSFNTNILSIANEVPGRIVFKSNATYHVNLDYEKEYTISCICPEKLVEILTSNNEVFPMVKDKETNLHTLTLKGSEIGTSIDFETEMTELYNVMVTEVDSDQPYSTNMISGIEPFTIVSGGINLIDINTANIKYDGGIEAVKDGSNIKIQNNDCKEGRTVVYIPASDDFEPFEGFYVSSFKINNFELSDNSRIKHHIYAGLVDLHGHVISESEDFILDDNGTIISKPFLVTRGNYVKGVSVIDKMTPIPDELKAIVSKVNYSISEVTLRYFKTLEDAENYIHDYTEYIKIEKTAITFDEPLYKLSENIYDIIDYKDKKLVRNVGVYKPNSDVKLEWNKDKEIFTLNNIIDNAQPNCNYVFSNLPIGKCHSKFSNAQFDGKSISFVLSSVPDNLSTEQILKFGEDWLLNSGFMMLYQLDNPNITYFTDVPTIKAPVKAGFYSVGSQVKPVLDWRTQQIDVSISTTNLYTVIFEVLNENLVEGNVFIGPNVTRNYHLVEGINRVTVKVDPETINDCNSVELDFPTAKIGRVMVVPGDYNDIQFGDQLENILFEEGIFESALEREEENGLYKLNIQSDRTKILPLLYHPLRGLPNNHYDEIDEIVFDDNGNGNVTRRIGEFIFDLVNKDNFEIVENTTNDVFEIVLLDNKNAEEKFAQTDNIGDSVMCSYMKKENKKFKYTAISVIDRKYNPMVECITTSEDRSKLLLQIPFTVINDYNEVKNYIRSKGDNIKIIYRLAEDIDGADSIPVNTLATRNLITSIKVENTIPPFINYMGINYKFEKDTLKDNTKYTLVFTADNTSGIKGKNIVVTLCEEQVELKLLKGINTYKVIIQTEFITKPNLVISCPGIDFSGIMLFEGDLSDDNNLPNTFFNGEKSVGEEISKGKYKIEIKGMEGSSLVFYTESPLKRVDDVFDSIEYDLFTRRYYHIQRIDPETNVIHPEPKFLDFVSEDSSVNPQIVLNDDKATNIETSTVVKAPFTIIPLEYYLNVKPNTNYNLVFIGEINSPRLQVKFNNRIIKTFSNENGEIGKTQLFNIPFNSKSVGNSKLIFDNNSRIRTDKIQYIRVFETTTNEQKHKLESANLNICGIESVAEKGYIDLVSYDKNLLNIKELAQQENLIGVDYILGENCTIRSKPLNSHGVLAIVDDINAPSKECISRLPHILPNTQYTLSFKARIISGQGFNINEFNILGYLSDDIKPSDISGIKIASNTEELYISDMVTEYSCTFETNYEVHGVGFSLVVDKLSENLVLEISNIQLERNSKVTECEDCTKYTQRIASRILEENPLRSLPNGVCDIIKEGQIERRTAMVKFTESDWEYLTSIDGNSQLRAVINTDLDNINIPANPIPVVGGRNNIICNFPISISSVPGIFADIRLMIETKSESTKPVYMLVASYNGIIEEERIRSILKQIPIILIYEIDKTVKENMEYFTHYAIEDNVLDQQRITNGQLTLTVYDAVRPFINAKIPEDTVSVVEQYKDEVDELRKEVDELREMNKTMQLLIAQTTPLYNAVNVLINHSVFYNYDHENENGEDMFVKLFGPFFVQQIKAGMSTIEDIVSIYEYEPLTNYLINELSK